jgi:hypothetical protein
MPRKEFESFTRLDASDVNTFLMDQSVMTFAGTAARGSAIGTAVEGMVTYLEDSNSLQLYDGSGWTSAGGVSSGNAIINGAFEINQRGFTSSTAEGYGFDRWQTTKAGTVTTSSQAFTLGAAPVVGFESTNFVRLLTSGQSGSSDYAALFQPIESVRSFAGQTVTISFYAKANSGTPKIALELNQNFGTGGSPSSAVSVPLSAITISTSWTRYSATVAVPSISGKTIGTANDSKLNLLLWVSAGSTFASRASSIGVQNNTFDIWGVQLEAGPVATPFRRNANSLQGELAACQRYYFRLSTGGNFRPYGNGLAGNTTDTDIVVNHPTMMRVPPTSVEFSNLLLSDKISGFSVSSLTLSHAGENKSLLAAVSSGLIAFRPYNLLNNGGASSVGHIGFSAEL